MPEDKIIEEQRDWRELARQDRRGREQAAEQELRRCIQRLAEIHRCQVVAVPALTNDGRITARIAVVAID